MVHEVALWYMLYTKLVFILASAISKLKSMDRKISVTRICADNFAVFSPCRASAQKRVKRTLIRLLIIYEIRVQN